MIRRRTLLTAALCAPAIRHARAELPVPPENRLAFSIVRKGGEIGKHILAFDFDDTRLTVKVVADIDIALGPIPLFTYRHRATEIWDGGRVVSLESTTNDNGTKHRVKMWREGDSLLVEGTDGPRYRAPADASPATHWNQGMLEGPMINTQNGKLLRPAISRVGIDGGPSGGARPAVHYTLRGDVEMDTWYAPTPRWTGLRFDGSDGVEIMYQPAN